jgi:hypothetical protein
LDGICPTGRAILADVMGYLIEIDPLRSLITWPQPEPDQPEIEEETAETLPEATAVHSQPELNFVLKQKDT